MDDLGGRVSLLRRFDRRRFLGAALTGGSGLAAAALVGCFGDDDDDDTATATPTADATASPEPTATPSPTATVPPGATPRRGGTLRLAATASPATLDPFRTRDAVARAPAAAVYGTLLREAPSTFEDFPSAEIEGFLAREFELTPDGLTLTLTLREGARFVPPGPGAAQPSAPIDRAVDSEDVRFSIERFLGRGDDEPAPNAAQLDLIEAVDTPDPQTALLRFDQTYARTLWRLADASNLLVMPHETGEAFDPAETMVGAGPFRWNGWQPDDNHRLLRNDGWWGGPDAPRVDGIEWLVRDPAAQLAAFLGGELDVVEALRADQVPELLEDFPAADVFARRLLGFAYIARGEPRDGSGAPDDPRVRHAISFALDRDELNETVYDFEALDEADIDGEELVGWHNMLPAGHARQSLDPRVDAATGTFVRLDRSEARKMLEAAGWSDGFATALHYTTAFGASWAREAELIAEQLAEIDIEVTPTVDDFATTYTEQTFRGEFEGLALQLQAFPDLGDLLQELYQPGGIRNHSMVEDQAILDAVTAIQTTLDPGDRDEQIRSVQRDLLLEPMWYVPAVGWQLGWSVWHPRLRAPGAKRHTAGRLGDVIAGYPAWWIDGEG